MTPITERLAEALREIAEYVAVNEMSIAPQLPVAPYNMQFIARTALAEYDRLRTHPAEGGEERDYEATLACPRCGRRRTTGAGRLPDWPACCNLVCHCTCHNDPLYCRECKNCDCHKAAPLPQPVAPAEGGEGRDYVLVPREPTEAMVSAGFDVHPCRTGETKVTDAYKSMLAAAPPPQPVAPEPKSRSQAKRFAALAPERGEAKAVAYTRTVIATDGPHGCNYCGGQAGGGSIYPKCPACGREPTTDAQTREVSYAPQPPPAPTFRDPTIEDAVLLAQHFAKDPWPRGVLKGLNAIGAKVEERP